MIEIDVAASVNGDDDDDEAANAAADRNDAVDEERVDALNKLGGGGD